MIALTGNTVLWFHGNLYVLCFELQGWLMLRVTNKMQHGLIYVLKPVWFRFSNGFLLFPWNENDSLKCRCIEFYTPIVIHCSLKVVYFHRLKVMRLLGFHKFHFNAT